MSQELTKAGTDHRAAGSTSDAIDDVPTTPPISFLRWAGPIMAVWAPVCALYFIDTQDARTWAPAAPFILFPVYAVIYLLRVHVHFSDHSVRKNIAMGLFLLVISTPFFYSIPHVVSYLAYLLVTVIGYSSVILILIFGLSILPLILIVVLVILGGIVVGGVSGLAFSLIERLTIGTNHLKANIYGISGSAVLALIIFFADTTIKQELLLSLALLSLLPVPHLILIWRRRIRWGAPAGSALTLRRALRMAVGIYAFVYVSGIIGFLGDFGAASLAWPKLVLENRVIYAYQETRREVLEQPDGRGALPIGGRAFLIPARLTEGGRQFWLDGSGEAGEYWALNLTVPYADWIEDFDAIEMPPLRSRELLDGVRVTLDSRAWRDPRDFALLCLPGRFSDLRQCFVEHGSMAWLERMGFEIDELERVHLTALSKSTIYGRVLVLLEDRIPGLGADQDVIQITAWCDDVSADDGDTRTADPPPVFLSESCVLAVEDGAVTASVEINPGALPHWLQIVGGLREDMAIWEAAAIGAERIDAVASREAEMLTPARAQASFWMDAHCMMFAAVGWKLAVGGGWPLQTLGSCPPIVLPQHGQEAG